MLGVTKASVSLWVRDIGLTDEQAASLRDKYHHYDAKIRGSQANLQKGLERRRAYQLDGRAKAREGDPMHLAGCMLYWAEGAKRRNVLRLTNSDPAMVQFFIRFLRQSLFVPDERIILHINCYTDNGKSVEEIERYWVDLLKLPFACLRKTQVNQQPKSSKQRGRKLIYGVCSISVHSTQVIHHVLGAIQEYIGIDKPEWLL